MNKKPEKIEQQLTVGSIVPIASMKINSLEERIEYLETKIIELQLELSTLREEHSA